MSKQKLLALFSVVGLLAVGVITYKTLQVEEIDMNSLQPPKLEQAQLLTGALSVNERWFTVDNEASKKNASVDGTLSNFTIFTLSPNFTSSGLDDFKDNAIISAGEEGFVLGTFENNKWKLSPEKNYLGASAMKESELRACGTYFFIKIHHDSDKSPKSSFKLDRDYMSMVTKDSESCTADDLGMEEKSWNLISTKLNTIADFDILMSKFDEYVSVWDTFIINQSPNQATVSGRELANKKLYFKADPIKELRDYFDSVRPSKQDMWVYVGNEKDLEDQNKVPTMDDQSFNVDLDQIAVPGGVGTLTAAGGDGDLIFSANSNNGFDVSPDGQVTVYNGGKLKITNTFQAKVEEKDNANDSDTATIEVVFNIDLDVCVATKERAEEKIEVMQGYINGGSGMDTPPSLMQPTPQEDIEILLDCAMFQDETQVSTSLISELKQLESKSQVLLSGETACEAELSSLGALTDIEYDQEVAEKVKNAVDFGCKIAIDIKADENSAYASCNNALSRHISTFPNYQSRITMTCTTEKSEEFNVMFDMNQEEFSIYESNQQEPSLCSVDLSEQDDATCPEPDLTPIDTVEFFAEA